VNKNQLLYMMNSIRDKYILEAVESRSTAGEKPKPHLRMHRVGLLAAVIAALLLLAGCVAVYLRLQDMSIGEKPYVQTHDEQGKAIEPTEKQWEVINFAGIAGSPEQKASAQWYEFTESYDPEHALMTNVGDDPAISNNYEYTYGCYTQEMVNKLDEIIHENQLTLLEAQIPIQRYQSNIALETLGKTSLLREDANASMGQVSGFLFAPYNFKLEYDFHDSGDSKTWGSRMSVTEIYNHNGYLPYNGYWLVDLPTYQQWSYTTSQGASLLLALNGTGQGFIICQLGSGILSISISSFFEENKIPDQKTLEAYAEVFDFDIVPQKFDVSGIQTKLDIADATEAAENVYVPETYSSYGEYLLKWRACWDKTLKYCIYDLDGDGTEDLLLGRDGAMDEWLTRKDGEVTPQPCMPGRICQGDMIENSYSYEFTKDKIYRYYPLSGAIMEFGDMTGNFYLLYQDGKWEQGSYNEVGVEANVQSITQEKADKIRAEHAPVALDWKPVWDYPMDDTGKTIGEYLTAQDEKPGSDEVRKAYAQYMPQEAYPDGTLLYTHYRLLDINGDGVDDLLLSGDGEKFWSLRTNRFGKIRYPDFPDFYLCADGILERVSQIRPYHLGLGVNVDIHEFYRITEDMQMEQVAYAAYNRSSDTWMSDEQGTVISAEEAQAILARYPRIDQGMRPISELLSQ